MLTDKTIERIMEFTRARDWDQFHTPGNLAKSISIEAGELLECFQWSDTEYKKEKVAEELADVMNYCVLLADKTGLDLDEIVNEKLRVNEEKYPVNKAKGTSRKYTEL